MAQVDEANLGWMAAVLDLRGKVTRKKNPQRRTPQIVLMVESKHPGVIQRLSKLTGTKPESRTAEYLNKEWMRRNCTQHCDEPHQHVQAGSLPSAWRWTVTGGSMSVILHNVIPYLATDQGWELLYQEGLDVSSVDGRGSTAAVRSLHRLQSLGWVLPAEILDRLQEQARIAPGEIDTTKRCTWVTPKLEQCTLYQGHPPFTGAVYEGLNINKEGHMWEDEDENG
jgi:hypothetical protein